MPGNLRQEIQETVGMGNKKGLCYTEDEKTTFLYLIDIAFTINTTE